MDHITNYGLRLRTELNIFLQSKQAASGCGQQEAAFLRKFRRFARGGKLLRGSLVCFSYHAFTGQRPPKAVRQAALAIELAHSGLLIHDDIMDGDELRRGQPSMHRQYQLMGNQRQLAHPHSFGINMALCGGDIALILAFELLSLTPNTTARQLFIKQLLKTCDGQMQDVALGASPAQPSKQALYRVMEDKTASYTTVLPLLLGATLANQPPHTLKQLQLFGAAAGIIFQIRDDELGALGSQKQTGKPVGADIREDKKTLLRYHLLKRCNSFEQRKLASIFGNPSATSRDISFVQSLLQTYEIPNQLAKEVDRLQRQASEAIDRLVVGDTPRQDFQELLIFCSRRQY